MMKWLKAVGMIAAVSIIMTVGITVYAKNTTYGNYGYVQGTMEGSVGRVTLRNTSSATRYGVASIYEYSRTMDSAIWLDSSSATLDYDRYTTAIATVTKTHAYGSGSLYTGKTSSSDVAERITCIFK